MNLRNRITVSIIIFSLFHLLALYAESSHLNELIAYSTTGEITAEPGKISAAVIAIEIPEGSYIYANPKGKGIGKATEVNIGKTGFMESWSVRYPGGEDYHAKGDADTVRIYKKSARIPVLFKVRSSILPGNYFFKAEISILMCTSEACIPVEKSVGFFVKVKSGIHNVSPVLMNSIGEYLSLKKNDLSGSEKNISRNSTEVISAESGIPDEITFTPRYPEGEITGLFQAILFGLIAGFLLNFMPCVLPVVSLKIMSFVLNAGEKRKVIALQGILFSSGILASFIVFAALAAFSGHKWGGLFQDRIFIIAMASFIFAMALSLFGVFTLNAPSSAGRAVSKTRNIYTDAFIKGGVATLLATPCSGPFLGGTLAWTLTRPPEIIFIIFLSVGTGMALPYLILALNPSFIRILPKPGVWMNHFETAMGFLLMFTVVYLLAILDNSAKMGLILFLLFMSIGLWQYGRFGSIDKENWKRRVSFVILIMIAAAGYWLSFSYVFNGKVYQHERVGFSAERILKNRDNGIITVVEFTAEWCPNCSLVEKLALEKDTVQKVFARDDVEFMIADITRKNPQAENLMNRLGSKSIPLLAILPPGEGFSSPYCLRDIYSAEDVVSNVKEAEKFFIKK